VIRNEEEKVLSAAASVAGGTALSIEFADGRVRAVAGESEAAAAPSPARKKPTSKAQPASSGQGSLF